MQSTATHPALAHPVTILRHQLAAIRQAAKNYERDFFASGPKEALDHYGTYMGVMHQFSPENYCRFDLDLEIQQALVTVLFDARLATKGVRRYLVDELGADESRTAVRDIQEELMEGIDLLRAHGPFWDSQSENRWRELLCSYETRAADLDVIAVAPVDDEQLDAWAAQLSSAALALRAIRQEWAGGDREKRHDLVREAIAATEAISLRIDYAATVSCGSRGRIENALQIASVCTCPAMNVATDRSDMPSDPRLGACLRQIERAVDALGGAVENPDGADDDSGTAATTAALVEDLFQRQPEYKLKSCREVGAAVERSAPAVVQTPAWIENAVSLGKRKPSRVPAPRPGTVFTGQSNPDYDPSIQADWENYERIVLEAMTPGQRAEYHAKTPEERRALCLAERKMDHASNK